MSSPSDKLPANRPIQERLTDAVAPVADLFKREHAEYALIGGLSVAFRGNKRTTEDADFLLHVSALKLPWLLTAMDQLISGK